MSILCETEHACYLRYCVRTEFHTTIDFHFTAMLMLMRMSSTCEHGLILKISDGNAACSVVTDCTFSSLLLSLCLFFGRDLFPSNTYSRYSRSLFFVG